jgi:CBS domain-containing protein
MRVRDVMVGTPVGCNSETNLGSAVEILWRQQCGILPIANCEEKIFGVVTDRDICIALGTRNRLPGEINVGEVATGKLYSCKPDDDIHTALATMGEMKVRRLPVIDAAGKLQGILSMDDVVLHAEPRGVGKTPELSYEDVMNTFKKIYEPPLPQVAQKKSAAA